MQTTTCRVEVKFSVLGVGRNHESGVQRIERTDALDHPLGIRQQRLAELVAVAEATNPYAQSNDGCAVGLWQHLHGLRDGNRSRSHRPSTRSTSQTPPSASRTSQIGARYQDSCRFRSLTMYWSLTMSSSRQVLVTKSAAVDALQVPRPWNTDATSRPSRSRRCS